MRASCLVRGTHIDAIFRSFAQPIKRPRPRAVLLHAVISHREILTSRSALEGERKQVTILFADIKDSTELIRDLDPEDAQKRLDPAIRIMMASVHRFEETVNQVLGDGIMSIFGAPIAHGDHAARAELATAIEMRRDMEMTFWLPETEAALSEVECL